MTVLEAPDDPEKTLQMAVTMQDLALLGLGLNIARALFPELKGITNRVAEKILELASAQEFLDA